MIPDDVVWVRTDADQEAGTDLISVRDAGGVDGGTVENRTAYGHGGVLPKDVECVMVRTADGGVAFAVESVRPPWADESGDVWSATAAGRGVRVSDVDAAIETRGAPVTLGADGLAIKSITRADDNCGRTSAMLTWMTAVNTAIGLIPGAVPPGIGPDNISITVSASQHKASL